MKSPKPVRKLAEPERVKHTSPKHVAKKILTPGKKGFSKASKPQELEPPPLKCTAEHEQQRTSLAKGPSSSLAQGPGGLAKGPSRTNAKGPQGLARGPACLAKGSMYGDGAPTRAN